jgi:glycosyltransferase involved in cell wall biosynthesis
MQSSDHIKISVITFVYASQGNGRLELLEECLQSVESQGHPSYEHIVVDDGSTEDVEALTGRFANTV